MCIPRFHRVERQAPSFVGIDDSAPMPSASTACRRPRMLRSARAAWTAHEQTDPGPPKMARLSFAYGSAVWAIVANQALGEAHAGSVQGRCSCRAEQLARDIPILVDRDGGRLCV